MDDESTVMSSSIDTDVCSPDSRADRSSEDEDEEGTSGGNEGMVSYEDDDDSDGAGTGLGEGAKGDAADREDTRCDTRP